MENATLNQEKKTSIFNNFIKFINKVVPKKQKEIVDDSRISKFRDFLFELDTNDPMYETVEKVADLCDEAIVVAKQRLQIIDRVQRLDEQMIELQSYENLSDEEIGHLKDLLNRFLALTDDKNILRFQITGFDKGLVEMEDLEEDARFSIPYIEEAEKNQRILKRDLSYLQGEKADLEYENEMLKHGQATIYRLCTILVTMFGSLAIILAYFNIFKGASIFYPVSILCILLIILITAIYIFRNKIRYELKINLLKQHRAVELINKKNVVYCYYTNFLRFVYKKYNVKSVEKLKKNIHDFGNYKHLTHRFDSIRSSMYETEYEIDAFLRDKSIVNNVITTEKFAKTVNIEDKRSYYQDLAKEKERLDKKLQDLDALHENIWNDLVVLNDNDKSQTKIIDRVIQKYLSEVARLVSVSQSAKEESDDEITLPPIPEIPTVGELIEKNDGIDKTDGIGYNTKNKIV